MKYTFLALLLVTACSHEPSFDSVVFDDSETVTATGSIFEASEANCQTATGSDGLQRFHRCSRPEQQSFQAMHATRSSSSLIENLPFHHRIVIDFSCRAFRPASAAYTIGDQSGSIAAGEDPTTLAIPSSMSPGTLVVTPNIGAANAFYPGCRLSVDHNYIVVDFDTLDVIIEILADTIDSMADVRMSLGVNQAYNDAVRGVQGAVRKMNREMAGLERNIRSENDPRKKLSLQAKLTRLSNNRDSLQNDVMGYLAVPCDGNNPTVSGRLCPEGSVLALGVLSTIEDAYKHDYLDPFSVFLSAEKARLIRMNAELAADIQVLLDSLPTL